MTSDGWHFLLFELNGDGTETFIMGGVPLSDPSVQRVLSGPHHITGTVDVPSDQLVLPDGSPLIRRWKTTVYVEDPNRDIWCGGIVADYTTEGPVLKLDVAGFTAHIKGQPYNADFNQQNVDPMAVVRNVWDHHQQQPGGNLGLIVDYVETPVLIGQPKPPAEGETTTTEDTGENVSTTGAVRLNWWSTDDSGGVIDELAKSTPFDYLEEHYWDGVTVRHRLRIGYPRIGNRLTEPRFVLGENVSIVPSEEYSGDDVVTEVWLLGSGEGRARIRGVAAVNPVNSIRRVKIIDDPKVQNQAEADQRARDELARYQPDTPGAGVTTLVVINHSNAEFGTYNVGDDILYSGKHEWGDVAIWVRIVSMTINPADGEALTLGVVRADTLKA